MANIGKLVNKAQKTIAVLLIAVIVLEFGSLTKFQKIWQLAFTGSSTSSGTSNSTTQSNSQPTGATGSNANPAFNIGSTFEQQKLGQAGP